MADLIDRVFDKTFLGLQKTLDLTYKRQEALTANIANAETPAYRARDLNFAGELERAFSSQAGEMKKTNSRHLDVNNEAGVAHLTTDYSGATKADGNNVDIDIQMGKLARNSGRYSLAAELVRKKLTIIKNAIRSGG